MQGLLFWVSFCGKDRQAKFGIGMESFTECGEGFLLELLSQEGEQGVSNESQVGQQVGIARAGTVLPHQGVAPPMIADFHTAPMSPDQSQPLALGILLWRSAGEIVARFDGGQVGALLSALAPHHDQAAGKGKVGSERFDGKGMDLPEFDTSMADLAVGKKGVLGVASRVWASWYKWGWFPLIWNR